MAAKCGTCSKFTPKSDGVYGTCSHFAVTVWRSMKACKEHETLAAHDAAKGGA